MTTTRFYLIAFIGTLAIVLRGQEGQFPPPVVPPTVHAQRATGKITIDGKLNEPDWEDAAPITEFFRVEPRQGGPYRYPTDARILYDDKNIYVGFFAADSLGKKGVRAQDLRRDFFWGENDILGIQLDPQNLKQYCVSFQTTPYGNQRDLQNFNDENTDNDWNALWSVRTERTDTGYHTPPSPTYPSPPTTSTTTCGSWAKQSKTSGPTSRRWGPASRLTPACSFPPFTSTTPSTTRGAGISGATGSTARFPSCTLSTTTTRSLVWTIRFGSSSLSEK